uniref:protein acetyllysine N-acetyltransferase n=1 Tax=Rhodosorus marinus TaxID=101924 RepID=A0A7S2ZML2_9RHOD|mmetsp:Transcript_24969/g.98650  ORF Transcript_24969/g.98650 Transcript_24969/m.98650 type:complete len:445 (+) Transcript_24969:364-1698(+)
MATSAAGSYAAKLTPGAHKGRLNLHEAHDPAQVLGPKVQALARLISESSRTVVLTGAGISTSAGIRDFRGPEGIWTKQKKGEPIVDGADFTTAAPTLAHVALVELHHRGLIKFLISQNVDGLHLRSGFPRDALAELHGNVFAEECRACDREYLRCYDVDSIGLRETGRACDQCGEALYDKLLDWNDPLPESELRRAEEETKLADLCIVMGSSMQMIPSRGLPQRTLRSGGKIVVLNLSNTHLDKQASVVIRADLDEVMLRLLDALHLSAPVYPARRKLRIRSRMGNGPKDRIYLSVDPMNGESLSFIRSVLFSCSGRSTEVFSEPFSVEMLVDEQESKAFDTAVRITVPSQTQRQVDIPKLVEQIVIEVDAYDDDSKYTDSVQRIRSQIETQESTPIDISRAEPAAYFFKSFRQRGFATCALCGEDVHGSRKSRHLGLCVADQR